MAPPKSKFGSERSASRNSLSTSGKSRRAVLNPIQRKAPAKNERPMKAIFKGKVISIGGTIMTTSKKDPQPITYEAIGKWITAHGGTYEREVSPDTTHLICSIEEYKKRTKQVRKAWELGKKQCKIVVFDWLEDCLLGKKLKKGLRPEGPYTLDRTLARIKKGFTDHAEYRRKFEEGTRASKALVDNKLNHVYCDPFDNFEYKVTLTRVNIVGKVHLEKYTCYLFESNAGPPSHFMTGAMLSRSHRAVTYYREHCHAMPFSQVFYYFKHFFRQKTGIDWDQRLEGIKMSDEYFVYTPPILGRPVGFVCAGYVRPELRARELTEGESEETGDEGDSEREGEVVYDTDSEVGDEDSEEDGRTITISSRSTGSREASEERSVMTISSDSRAASEEQSVQTISSGSEDEGSGGGFGGSLDGRFGEMSSGMGSEHSGESEQTQTLTLGSQESDGLRGVLEQVVRARTPPGLIYLSD